MKLKDLPIGTNFNTNIDSIIHSALSRNVITNNHNFIKINQENPVTLTPTYNFTQCLDMTTFNVVFIHDETETTPITNIQTTTEFWMLSTRELENPTKCKRDDNIPLELNPELSSNQTIYLRRNNPSPNIIKQHNQQSPNHKSHYQIKLVACIVNKEYGKFVSFK